MRLFIVNLVNKEHTDGKFILFLMPGALNKKQLQKKLSRKKTDKQRRKRQRYEKRKEKKQLQQLNNTTNPQRCFVFLCNNQTERDCVQRNLCAVQRSYQNRTAGIERGTVILLWNFQSCRALFPCYANGQPFVVTKYQNRKLTNKTFDNKYPVQVDIDQSQAVWHSNTGKNKRTFGWIDFDFFMRNEMKITQAMQNNREEESFSRSRSRSFSRSRSRSYSRSRSRSRSRLYGP